MKNGMDPPDDNKDKDYGKAPTTTTATARLLKKRQVSLSSLLSLN
jgi:hypothetical protein